MDEYEIKLTEVSTVNKVNKSSCSCVSQSVHTCSCVSQSVHTCSCVSQSVHTCSCVSQSVHTCSCVSQSVHTCSCVIQSVHTCSYVSQFVHTWLAFNMSLICEVKSVVLSNAVRQSWQAKVTPSHNAVSYSY